ncbi:MAG: hypothetical protein IJG67_00375 [Oscillospiraceae bacterium]|nr:hypothetical protein [Oscillospiraceae bacterium]
MTESFNLCPEYFTDEFRAALNIISEDDVVLQQMIPALEAFVLGPLADKLRSYCRMDAEGGRKAADEMADLLRKVRSDDISFPQSQIMMIMRCTEDKGSE